MDSNDVLLVRQLKDRKEEAYVFLFRQYYNRLYRFAPIIYVIRMQLMI